MLYTTSVQIGVPTYSKNARALKFGSIAALGLLTLGACTSNFAVYESPNRGRLATITVVNEAETQNARFATFDDGRTCTRRRHIQFTSGEAITPGESLSFSVAAGKDVSVFAALDRISTNEYAVDVGMTGGGPTPVVTPTVTALGCNAIVTLDVEPGQDYRVAVSEAATSRSCAIEAAEISDGGNRLAVKAVERVARFPRDERGSFCE